MLTGAAVLFQRMRIEEGAEVSPDDPSVLGVEIAQSSVTEGVVIAASIKRMGGRRDQAVTITYTWSSTGGAADLTAPLAVTVTISANVLELAINMQTIARAGTQGNREVRVTLSNPINCSIADSNAFDVCTLSDPIPVQAVIGAFAVSSATAIEGDVITAQIRRVSGDASATVLVDWLWQSSLGDTDFTPASVLSGQATINSSISQVNAAVTTAIKTGAQGDRVINFLITGFDNGQLSSANPVAAFILKDTLPSTPTTVGIFAASTTDIPDDGSVPIVMNLKRTSTDNNAVTVNYAFTSSLHARDFAAGAVTSGTARLEAGVNQTNISVALRDRSAELQGERTITCTISNPVGCVITDAMASQTLTDSDTGTPPEPPAGGLPKLQPVVDSATTRGKWHAVGFSEGTLSGCKAYYGPGRAGFVDAIAAAASGEVIVLKDDTYAGTKITIGSTRNGAASTDGSKHIMVRAKNHGKAVIDCQLEISGKYWWFTGIEFTYNGVLNPNYQSDGQAILVTGAGFWVTNCRFTGYSFTKLYPSAALSNLRICYNNVNASTRADGTDTGLVVAMNMDGTSRCPPDTEIAWNIVTLNIEPSVKEVSRPMIIVHHSHSMQADQTSFVTRTFKFHHNHCVGKWAEAFYIKRNVCIEFNYIKWTGHKASYWGVLFRHGLLTNNPQYDSGGIIRGNRLHSDLKKVVIDVGGAGVTITNNRFEGTANGEILLAAGNGLGNFGENKPNRDGAVNAQIVENFGFDKVVVGVTPAGDDLIKGETAGHRNGWPSNVRIYKGDSNWSPTISRPLDGVGKQAPAPTIMTANYGAGTAAKCGTIAEADLTDADPPVGCDTIA